MMVAVLMAAVLAGGCAQQYKKTEKQMKAPINGATAQGDIRMLMHEKADVADQIAQGVTAIFPAGLELGVATGTEETKCRLPQGNITQ